MGATERLRDLDRRAETYGQRFKRKHDTEPPVWLRYAGFGFIMLGPLSIPLTLATSAFVTLSVAGVAMLAYVLVAWSWSSRHRL